MDDSNKFNHLFLPLNSYILSFPQTSDNFLISSTVLKLYFIYLISAICLRCFNRIWTLILSLSFSLISNSSIASMIFGNTAYNNTVKLTRNFLVISWCMHPEHQYWFDKNFDHDYSMASSKHLIVYSDLLYALTV